MRMFIVAGQSLFAAVADWECCFYYLLSCY